MIFIYSTKWPCLASLGNSRPPPQTVPAFQSIVAFSGGTTAVKENWLTARTFARCCIFSPNYSTKKSTFNAFTFQADYCRGHLYYLAQEQNGRLFYWQNASAVWYIYGINDGLIARLSLNVFLYFKELRGYFILKYNHTCNGFLKLEEQATSNEHTFLKPGCLVISKTNLPALKKK